MAKYDAPNMIDYVLQYTNHTQLAYVGHSQGTIQMFASPTFNMDINDKIAIYGAFAPIAYEHHCKSVLLDLLAYLDVDVIFEIFGKKQFLPGKNFVNRIAPDYCYHHPQLCDDELMLIVGPSQDLNASRIQVYVSETPADTSVKNMAHWSQDIKKRKIWNV